MFERDGSYELDLVIDTRWIPEKGFDMIPPLPRGAIDAALMLFAFGAQYSDIRKKSAWVEVAKLCHWVGIPSNLKPYHAKRDLQRAMVRVNEYLADWVNHVLDHTDDTENVSFRKLNMPYRFALEFYTEEDGTSYVHVAVGNWLAYEKPESEGERPPRTLEEYARHQRPKKRPAKPKTYWDMVKEAERKMSNG